MKRRNKKLKVAITHDYLLTYGGAEVVLKELLSIYPDAVLYTPIVWLDNSSSDLVAELKKHRVVTSHINKYTVLKKAWKLFLPNFASFFEHIDFKGYDLIISSSASFAKWINRGKAKHIGYIHTPPRFLWGMETTFYHKIPAVARAIISKKHFEWKEKDKEYAKKANVLIANSNYIRSRIREFYKRDSIVIYPPVTQAEVKLKDIKAKDYYLVVNRLVAPKRIDEIIKAFKGSDRKLVIVGDGPEMHNLKKLADETVFFAGFVDEETKSNYIKQSKAVIYSGLEDFGIGMVEALSFGKPVLAYKGGGALDTIDNKSGVLFTENNAESIQAAIQKFEKTTYDPEYIQKKAHRFSPDKFRTELKKITDTLV